MRWAVAVSLLFLLGAATSQPSSQPVGEKQVLGGGLIQFVGPPSPPWSMTAGAGGDAALFIDSNKDGAIQISLLPKDANVDPGVADQVAVAILKQLRSQRTASGVTVVMPAKIERDKRFAIVIHEKYKVGEKTADELHLYKSVGPRVVMLTVNTVADDADAVTATHELGEKVLAGAKYNRAVEK
jgi:hypothetical protein